MDCGDEVTLLLTALRVRVIFFPLRFYGGKNCYPSPYHFWRDSDARKPNQVRTTDAQAEWNPTSFVVLQSAHGIPEQADVRESAERGADRGE